MSPTTLTDAVVALRERQPVPEWVDNPINTRLEEILFDLHSARNHFSPESVSHDLLRFHMKRAQARVLSLLGDLRQVQAQLAASPSTIPCAQTAPSPSK